MRKFTVTLNERQLRIIAECVEDVSRFISGQMELWNATSQYLPDHHELHTELAKLQPLVTPDLQRGSSHKWNGVSCKNKAQGQFIAESYYIYHEIMHQLLKDKVSAANVYYSPTLRCENSGDPIVIEEVKESLVFDREYSERIIKQCEEEMQNPIISEKDRQRCEWVIAFHKCAIEWHERKDKNMEYMDGDRWDDKKTCSRKTNRVI
jgi:hypothetical protein